MTVNFGGSAALGLAPDESAEFVFFVESSIGKWLVTRTRTFAPD